RIRGRADACVDDDRHADRLEDDLDVVRVADAEARSDRRPERHDDGGAGVLELLGHHRVVVRVGHHGEAFARQGARGLEQTEHVWKERARVTDHLELDHLAETSLARQVARANRLVGGVAPGGVGQERVARRVQMIEDRFTRGQTNPAQRHRHDLRARRFVRSLHDVHRRVLSRADDQARREFLASDDQIRIAHGSTSLRYPPPMGLTISTRSPSRSTVASYAPFGVTSRFTATAVYWRLTLRCTSSPSTFSPSATSRSLPLTTIFINKTAASPRRVRPLSFPPCSLRWHYPVQVRGVPGRTRFSGILPPRRQV